MDLYVSKPVYVTAWKNREDISIVINGLSVPPGSWFIENVKTKDKEVMTNEIFEHFYVSVKSVENTYKSKEDWTEEMNELEEIALIDEVLNDN